MDWDDDSHTFSFRRNKSHLVLLVLFHQHHPSPTNQNWDPACFAGGGDQESRNQGLHIKPELNVPFKMPLRFPWNQEDFMGNQQQSGRIQGWSHHPTPLLLHPALPSHLLALEKLWLHYIPQNISEFQCIIYNLIMDSNQKKLETVWYEIPAPGCGRKFLNISYCEQILCTLLKNNNNKKSSNLCSLTWHFVRMLNGSGCSQLNPAYLDLGGGYFIFTSNFLQAY